MALATILQKLLSVQVLLGPILTVFGPNDLEGQDQMSPYAIPSENYPRFIQRSKFGDPSYNPSKVIKCTSPFLANFDRFWPKWPWRSRSNVTLCNPIQELSKMHITAKFGSPSYKPSKVIGSTSPFSANFWPFSAQMTWKVKVKCRHIQFHPRTIQDASNCQFWWP